VVKTNGTHTPPYYQFPLFPHSHAWQTKGQRHVNYSGQFERILEIHDTIDARLSCSDRKGQGGAAACNSMDDVIFFLIIWRVGSCEREPVGEAIPRRWCCVLARCEGSSRWYSFNLSAGRSSFVQAAAYNEEALLQPTMIIFVQREYYHAKVTLPPWTREGD
jgi:hypothetical protein